jgi:hypothetical protein
MSARLIAAVLLASAAALPAHAQPCGTRTGGAPTLTAGQTVAGTLAREDMTLPGDRYNGTDACTGRPYDSYFYEAQAGERLTFVLESREIDPQVTATTHWRGGGPRDVVEQRGRRGRTLSAEGTVPAAGRILIQVASNVSLGRPGSTGAYTFTVRSNRPGGAQPSNGGGSPASTGTALRLGQTARGELTSRNGKLADDSYFQDYTYTARRGERLVAVLRSEDFDAFLHVGRRAADGTLQNRASDDDGAGGTDAQVEYTADQDGPVTIRVNTLAEGETGSFTLELRAAGPGNGGSDNGGRTEPAAGIPTLRAGQTMRGELARGDGQLEDGSFYDVYTYVARRGERLVVRMSSDDFDTVLGVSQARENADDLVMDDDGGGGTNSRVEYTATADGPLLIRANALHEGDAGRYTIVVESARRSALPASAEPLARGGTMDAPRAPSASLALAPAAAYRAMDARMAAPRLPRASAAGSRAQSWGMAALGVGMIFAGLELEDTPVEPLGSLVRYTGYAMIVFAPFGS